MKATGQRKIMPTWISLSFCRLFFKSFAKLLTNFEKSIKPKVGEGERRQRKENKKLFTTINVSAKQLSEKERGGKYEKFVYVYVRHLRFFQGQAGQVPELRNRANHVYQRHSRRVSGQHGRRHALNERV